MREQIDETLTAISEESGDNPEDAIDDAFASFDTGTKEELEEADFNEKNHDLMKQILKPFNDDN